MSYCRIGDDSDVYLIRSVYGNLVCMHRNAVTPEYACEGETEMFEHLFEHMVKGDKVPFRALARLEEEIQDRELVSVA